MFGLPIGHISVLLLIPVLGAGLLVFVPRRQTQTLFSLATLAPGASAEFTGSYTLAEVCCEVVDVLTAKGKDRCT